MRSIIPAICNNPACRSVFFSDRVIAGPIGSISNFHDCTLGPCPTCGSDGKIPDGQYRIENDSTRFTPRTPFDLQQLQLAIQIIKSGLRNNSKPEDIEEELERRALGASRLWTSIPKPIKNQKAFWNIIAALGTVAAATGTWYGAISQKPAIIEQHIGPEFNYYLPDSYDLESFDAPTQPPTESQSKPKKEPNKPDLV